MDVRAAKAYSEALNRAASGSGGGGDAADVAGKAGKNDFSSVLSDVVNSTVSSLKESEKMSMAAAAGKADIVDVVSSVTNAEVTLQAVVAVRDKVIAAYQDIMKMPI
ncbi:MAG TPA: flagellar hook-basal body complex protein FliE [Alphaproteobacteria bacterium]|nr:flagellar hook-basal body complex protein FliE [Alphaproteobacteria bacterium]